MQAQVSAVDQVLETDYLFQLFVISLNATGSLAILLCDRIGIYNLFHMDIHTEKCSMEHYVAP